MMSTASGKDEFPDQEHGGWLGVLERLKDQLHIACSKGQLDLICFLIDKCKCDPNHRGTNGWVPLHDACYSGNLSVVSYLIEQCSSDPACKDMMGCTPLHISSLSGHLKIVKKLVSKCFCDPMQKECVNGSTSLHLACQNGHLEVFKFFIEKCMCDPNSKNDNLYTPLHIASTFGHLSIVKYLVHIVDTECDPKEKGGEIGDTSMHLACEKGHVNVLKFFIEYCKCYPNIRNFNNFTPLHTASLSGQLEVVKYLVSNCNCDPEEKGCGNGVTSMHLTCVRGHVDVLKFFIEDCKCDPNFRSKDLTPLHNASWFGQLEVVKYLVGNCNCDPKEKGGADGDTSMHLACQRGHINVLKFFIEDCKCDPNIRDIKDCTPLHIASYSGQLEVVEYLVRNCNCDPKEKLGENGYTSMHLACQRGHINVLKFFIEDCKCDPNIRNIKDSTLLHTASFSGQLEVVKYLVSNCNCDPKEKAGADGDTSMHLACQRGHVNILKFFIDDCKCDLNIRNIKDCTPLHIASYSGQLEVVRYLVRNCNCDPKEKLGENGYTSMHLACQEGHVSVLNFFFEECKLDPNCIYSSIEEPTPLCIGSMVGQLKVVKYLVEICNCDPQESGGKSYFTSLNVACDCGYFNLVQYFIEECGCEPKHSNFNGTTYLHNACSGSELTLVRYARAKNKYEVLSKEEYKASCGHEHFKIIEYLIKRQHSILYSTQNDGTSPLHLACLSGDIKVVKYLIEKANLNPASERKDGSTPLHDACASGHTHVMEYLITKCNCDPMPSCSSIYSPVRMLASIHLSMVNKDTHEPKFEFINLVTPLHIACYCGHFDIVKYLIEKVSSSKSFLNELLYVVCGHIHDFKVDITPFCSGNLKIIDYLIRLCECDPNAKLEDGLTPLHLACDVGCLETVRFLITEFNCDHTCKLEDGTSCLHISSRFGHLNVVEFLIEHCKHFPECKDLKGCTPLHEACTNGHLKVVKYLIDQCNCDPMRGYCNGYTPVHYACINGHFDVVQYIVQKFPNNVSFASNGDTILHSALRNGHNEIVTYLITELNFNPNYINQNCETLLHLACDNADVQMVQLLVSTSKINVDAKDRNSRTALQRVKSNKTEIKKVFTKYKERLYIPIIHSYSNVVVLGKPRAGKSSLIQVIRQRSAGGSNCCCEYYLSMQHIKNVDQHTVGIVPYRLEHEEIGNIILHDLAGHPEFYFSHDAAIGNHLKNNGGVIIITVCLAQEKITNILKDYREWLAVVANLLCINDNISMITVASHADCIDVKRRETLRLELIKECKTFFIDECMQGTEVVFLNCCKCGGGQLPRFLKLLRSACNQCSSTKTDTRTITADDEHCSQLYAFLLETERNVFKFDELKGILEKGKDYLKLVYSSRGKLYSALSSLHKVGLITFLSDIRTQEECDGWIIIHTGELLNEMEKVLFINGKEVATNTGIVSLSKLKQIFKHYIYDVEMLVKFFDSMKLCVPFTGDRSPFFNEQNIRKLSDSSDKLLFFPALIHEIDQPTCEHIRGQFTFGWFLQCPPHQHFSTKFLHLLLVKISYGYAIAHSLCNQYERRCIIWRNGILMASRSGPGAQIIVEVVDHNQCVLLLMSASPNKEDSHLENIINTRRNIINDILNLCKEECSSFELQDFVIDPSKIHYPMDDPSSLMSEGYVFDVAAIADSVANNNICTMPYEKSIYDEAIPLTKIFPDEAIGPRLSVFVDRSLIELSQGLIQNASNSTQDHSKPLKCQPHDIIKRHMPKLNEVISTPDQLAEQLWSADFISDYEEDAFSTTDGQSRYKKARVLTRKLYEYFKVSDKDKVRKFRELCEILKDHCGPASLPTQMMDELMNSMKISNRN